MAPADKDGIQTDVMPVVAGAVKQALAECNWDASSEQIKEFVRLLTSPELHEEAA
jgi:hypothetical protein